MKYLLAGTIALVAFASASVARAADMPVKAPPPPAPAAYSWTGAYIGGNIGYGWSGNTGAGWSSFTDPGGAFGAATYFALGGNVLPGVKPAGVLGGGQIGYDWQLSPTVVLGVVTDLDASGMKGAGASAVAPGGAAASIQSNSAQIKWVGTTRIKVGFASDRWLVYGTGGLAYGRVSEQNGLNCVGCGGTVIFSGSNSATNTGGAIGAGLEYGLTPNWTIGTEYLYLDLGKVSTTASDIIAPGVTFTSTAKIQSSIVRINLDYKFN
jgi:outer membrane immunogenic protein